MEKERLKFLENINSKLVGEKKFVVVSGASSSGKSFVSSQIVDYLNKQGKKAILISADNYYKGITRMIVQKALENNNYSNFVKEKFATICKVVKSIINDTPFPQKLCENNANLIKNELNKIIGSEIAEKLVKDITYEFSVINFDKPFAVDLNLLAKHINMLNKKQDIIVPDYSFATGEIEYYEKNKIIAKDYDVFVIEGIYALNEKVISQIDKKTYISGAIECDLKTLISRKLDRDITKQRSKQTKEQVVMSYLTQVMPSFFEYIYPTLKNVDVKFCTSLTDDEVKERNDVRQRKYYACENIYDFLAVKGEFLGTELQKDYFLEDKYYSSNKNIVLRVREVDGKVKNLTIKTDDDIKNLKRKVEEYSFDSFSDESSKISNVLTKFLSSGFYLSNTVEKTRQIYKYNGAIIKVDKCDGKIYIEEDDSFKGKIRSDEIGNFLTSEIDKSYYQIAKEYEEEYNAIHKECELKLKLNENINKIIKNYDCKIIEQEYIDLTKEEGAMFVKNFIPDNFDLSLFSEARIRKINSNKCYLTLKSSGDLQRTEYEKEIPICLAEKLDKNIVKGLIKKSRYDIMLTKDIQISIDVYLDRQLYIAEVEFDKNLYQEEQILNLVKKALFNCVIENVTDNVLYKNSHLAK